MNKAMSIGMAVLLGLAGLLHTSYSQTREPDLKRAAFEVLQVRCNSCHRRQNPFRVFSLRNMDRQAKRIYQVVFVEKRMPKGEAPRLTPQESQTLQAWISTLNN